MRTLMTAKYTSNCHHSNKFDGILSFIHNSKLDVICFKPFTNKLPRYHFFTTDWKCTSNITRMGCWSKHQMELHNLWQRWQRMCDSRLLILFSRRSSSPVWSFYFFYQLQNIQIHQAKIRFGRADFWFVAPFTLQLHAQNNW